MRGLFWKAVVQASCHSWMLSGEMTRGLGAWGCWRVFGFGFGGGGGGFLRLERVLVLSSGAAWLLYLCLLRRLCRARSLAFSLLASRRASRSRREAREA